VGRGKASKAGTAPAAVQDPPPGDVFVAEAPVPDREDSVLIGCPTYKGLAPILKEWLEHVAALHWKNRRTILVDNTADGGKYADRVRRKWTKVYGDLDVRHVEPSKDWEDTFYRSWRVIADHAEFNGYDWVWSLEQDVIVPELTLDTLLNVAGYIKAPFVTHTYPYHNGRPGYYQGLGCTLMKMELLIGALGIAYKRVPLVEGAVYDVAKRGTHASLHEVLAIEHRDNDGRYWQFGTLDGEEAAVRIEP